MADRDPREGDTSATLPPVPAPAPRPKPKRTLRWLRPGRFLRDLNILALLIVIAAGAALLLLPGSDDGLLGLPRLVVGQDAPRTIKSPRTFAIADPDTTDRLRKEAREHMLPIYDLAAGEGGEVKERIEAAFAADAKLRQTDGGVAREAREAREIRETGAERARAQEFMRALQTVLDEDVAITLIRAPVPDELRDASIMIAQTIYESRIVEDRALLPQLLQLREVDPDGSASREESLGRDDRTLVNIGQARARVDDLVAEQFKRLPVEQRRAVAMLVKQLLHPNVVPNRAETEQRIEAAGNAVKTVVVQIKQGETVLRAGERVTERHLFILQGIEKELRSQSRVQASLGSALLIVLLVVLIYRFMSRSYRGFEPSHRDLAFLASAYVLMLLLTWVGYKGTIWLGEAEPIPLIPPSAYRLLLPVAAGSLLVRFAIGAEFAAAFVPLASLTAGFMMGSLNFAVYALCGSFAAITVRDTGRPRTALFASGLRAAFAQGVVVVGLALLESRVALEDTGSELLVAVASGMFSAIIAASLLPAVEVLFGYTTELKLTDLANLNHPLLRELLVAAPGTYQHSILVGTLAEAGAAAIGANGLLARVGAYYHDIGKIVNPRSFEENVAAPSFVSVAPVDEAKSIRMHVADGLELAAKNRLGQPILEIIAQHHGTSVVRSSYRRANDLASGVRDRSEYAYPGPKPLSREGALVMLADFVEVATRDLAAEVALDRQMIESAVKKVVDEVLADGQLNVCELTLRDLGAIILAFTEELEDRFIRRGRPALSTLPKVQTPRLVRPPSSLGELN